jgi:BON domain
MKRILCGIVLLASTVALAQMGPAQPQPGQQPPSTPPTFPNDRQSPRTMPPDQNAPAPTPEAASAEQIEQQITQQLTADPKLEGTNVRADVDEASIVLSGTVNTAEQRDLAVEIARSHAGDRNVVDKIKVKQQT